MSRAVARFPILIPRLGAVALACASVLLASCGGGDRKSYFTPGNIVSFGDENSLNAEFTSANLQNKNGAQVTLKGLSYTAKAVSVVTETCANNTVEPALCTGTTSNPFVAPGVIDVPRYMLNDTTSAVSTIARDTTNSTQQVSTVSHFCDTPKTWVQVVAAAYGKGFSGDCPIESRSGAVSHATLGAKTADVIAQINAHRGSLNSNTVVTIMVGQNDVIEQFEAIVASSQNEGGAIAVLQGRADSMAAAIKGVIGTGAKVILALTPDLSESPYGLAASSTNRAVLDRLVRAYNDRLYISGLGNVSGRSLAGVNPESYTQPGTRSTSYQYTTPLCDAAAVRRPDGTTPANDDENLLYCTSQFYTSGTSASTAIWADAKRAAPLLHNLIGVTAYNRAREQF
jgi:lysophospholipase L1-like esterase